MEKELRQVLQRLDKKARQLEKEAFTAFKKIEKKYDHELMDSCINKKGRANGIFFAINSIRQIYKVKELAGK